MSKYYFRNVHIFFIDTLYRNLLEHTLVPIHIPIRDEEEIKQILSDENVEYEVRGVYGVYDIVLKISSDDAEKLRAIITNKIRKISKVQSTLTMMVIEEQENL